MPGTKPSRLDRLLRGLHPNLSWQKVRDAIAKGQVTVDGQVELDGGRVVPSGASIVLDQNRPATRRVRAPFDILYEDPEILVVNKPAGVLTIPSSPFAGGREDTILGRARGYLAFKRGRQGYVGVLHRLDRETSGALAMALSRDAHARGRDLFKHHRFDRRYLALVQGVPNPRRGTIEARVSSLYAGGRRRLVGPAGRGLDATTDYDVREAFSGAALVELTLHTGRQHQIRLHLERLGHPLVGETVYTGADGTLGAARPMLHAWALAFPHPTTGARISVEAKVPDDFERERRRLAGRRRG